MSTAAVATPAAATPPPTSISRGVWGMWMMILTELMIFAALIGSYFYVHAGEGVEAPELARISAFSLVLLGSSVPMHWAEAGIRRGRVGQLKAGLLIAFVMGAVFFGNQVVEYTELDFDWRQSVHGSFFYAITGLHGAHLVVGLLMNGVVQAKAWKGRLSAERHRTVEVVTLYWHFVDAVWILVFSTLYLSPHLL